MKKKNYFNYIEFGTMMTINTVVRDLIEMKMQLEKEIVCDEFSNLILVTYILEFVNQSKHC